LLMVTSPVICFYEEDETRQRKLLDFVGSLRMKYGAEQTTKRLNDLVNLRISRLNKQM